MNGGEAIKHFRELRGLTLDDLAAKVGVKASAVTKWQSGEIAAPRRATLERIDAVLDAGGEIIRAYGHATVDPPADLGDMLAEILSEIRTHRRSDIAPTARLADMPTLAELRAEVKAEVEALRTELRADAAIAAVARNQEIDGLIRAIAALDKKVEGLRRSRSDDPGTRSASVEAGSTSRSRSRTPHSGAD